MVDLELCLCLHRLAKTHSSPLDQVKCHASSLLLEKVSRPVPERDFWFQMQRYSSSWFRKLLIWFQKLLFRFESRRHLATFDEKTHFEDDNV